MMFFIGSEIDVEMRSHVEVQAQKNIGTGMKPKEARYVAIQALGFAGAQERGSAFSPKPRAIRISA